MNETKAATQDCDRIKAENAALRHALLVAHAELVTIRARVGEPYCTDLSNALKIIKRALAPIEPKRAEGRTDAP